MKFATFLLLAVLACSFDTGFANPAGSKSRNRCHRPETEKCTRPHEIFACGSACQTTCKTLNKPCGIVNIKCNDMCYCEKGYARDQTGNCVLERDCDDRLNCICGINEKYSCKNYFTDECSGQKLSEREIPDMKSCGCFCKPEFKRHASGLCVPTADCKLPVACVRPNEEYRCGSACQTQCNNSHSVCPILNKKCKNDCYCKKGFARISDEKSKCIPIKECSKKQ